MKCQECGVKTATKKFSDAYETVEVCNTCFDKLDYEEWSNGVDKAFGSREDMRKKFKNGLITFTTFVVFAIIIFAIDFFVRN